jgi:hypothetical protein
MLIVFSEIGLGGAGDSFHSTMARSLSFHGYFRCILSICQVLTSDNLNQLCLARYGSEILQLSMN